MAKYSEYSGSNACFINPYNFVKVDFDKAPERVRVSEIFKGHSGVLHCELMTKTPISIPDMEKVSGLSGHKELPFMRCAEGAPMIPGSALRGPIRSVYETLTNSCMSTVDEDQSITYRTRTAFSPALLYIDDSGIYHLFQAKRYIFGVTGGSYSRFDKERDLFKISHEDLASYAYGQTVYIKAVKTDEKEKTFSTSRGYPTKSVYISEMSSDKKDGFKEGYICIGEPFNNKKHFESVFVKTGEIDLTENDKGMKSLKKATKDLSEILKCYNDEKINANAKNHPFYSGRDYKEIKRGVYYPVWCKIEKDSEGVVINVHLSVANLGRAAYNKDMGDMLLDHKSCTCRGELCPACRLFGMTGDDSIGSRVRIADAMMDRTMEPVKYVVLKELSGPKTSYMPFYLRKKAGKVGDDISYDNDTYIIRGRKFYWHNTVSDAYREPNNEKTDRNASVELVEKGNTFKFDVFYDNLSDNELKALIWTITLGENDIDGKQCYKIGHGKPIGLGSVKIVVKSANERIFDGNGYSVKRTDAPAPELGSLIKDSVTVDQIRMITDITECKLPVDYPGIVDSSGKKYHDGSNNHASHQWFTSNFTLGRPPVQALPDIGKENDEQVALKWRTDSEGGVGDTKKSFSCTTENIKANKKKCTYVINERYEGIIIGYNEIKTVATVSLANGGRASLYFKKVKGAFYGKIDSVLRLNETIVVEYEGKDDKGFDQWKLIGKQKE